MQNLTIYWLKSRLKRPYRLSFGEVNQFNSFVGVLKAGNRFVLSETTPLPGYSHETPEFLAEAFHELEKSGDLDAFYLRHRHDPFVTSVIYTLNQSEAFAALNDPVQATVPLCPILQYDDFADIERALSDLDMVSSVKVKLSSNIGASRELIQRLQGLYRVGGPKFRFDANQAYDLSGAKHVAALLEHESTELLEQPLGTDAWEDMRRLNEMTSVPLMLDEAIVSEHSVEKAVGCCQLVKLKLAKNGSPGTVLRMIHRATELGLQTILGNGVQGVVGCYLEALIHLKSGMKTAGEMNGYRKLAELETMKLFEDEAGGMVINPAPDFSAVVGFLERSCFRKYTITVGSDDGT